MKIADILRHVADQMDHEEHEAREIDPANEVPRETEDPTTMVPPLQQKIELLKKAAGEDSYADAREKLTHAGEHDELDDIKRIAGLTVMIDGPQGEMG
jgi:hypothetical protein